MIMNRLMRIPFTRIDVITMRPWPGSGRFFEVTREGDADLQVQIGNLNAMVFTNQPPLQQCKREMGW